VFSISSPTHSFTISSDSILHQRPPNWTITKNNSKKRKKRQKSAKISLQIQALDVAGSGLTKIDRREKQKLRAYISLLFFPGGFFVSLLLVAGK